MSGPNQSKCNLCGKWSWDDEACACRENSELAPARLLACPHCGKPINIGALLGAQTSEAKAEAARRNGAKGGRPRKPKRVARRSNDQAHL